MSHKRSQARGLFEPGGEVKEIVEGGKKTASTDSKKPSPSSASGSGQKEEQAAKKGKGAKTGPEGRS